MKGPNTWAQPAFWQPTHPINFEIKLRRKSIFPSLTHSNRGPRHLQFYLRLRLKSKKKQKKQTNENNNCCLLYLKWSRQTEGTQTSALKKPNYFFILLCPGSGSEGLVVLQISTHALQNMQLKTAAAFPLKLGLSGPHPRMFWEFSDGGRSRRLQRIRGGKRLMTKTGCRYFKLC